jgi:hypothetical protein
MTLFARKEYSVIHQLFLYTWAQLPLASQTFRSSLGLTGAYAGL